MISIKSLVLALGLAQGLLCQALEPLRFNSDGSFKIAFFTDLHYGESPDLDLRSNEVQRMVLETEHPDFIVFGGDMVSGWEANGKYGWFENLWRQLTLPAREYQIPYALILGNHDDEGNLNRRQILQYDIEMYSDDGLSYTQQGPQRIGGASNYYLNIFPGSSPHVEDSSTASHVIRSQSGPLPSTSNSGNTNSNIAASAGNALQPLSEEINGNESPENGTEFSTQREGEPRINPTQTLLTPADSEDPIARLWFFDSMNRGCLDEKDSWGCVAPTAVEWASTTSKTIPLVPTAMAFVHIPIPESVNVWEESTEPVYGQKREFSNCQGGNTGLHNFAKEHGVQAVWSGHDHVNDFVGVWEGVRIGYGRKSGYGSYFYGNTVEIIEKENTSRSSSSGGSGSRQVFLVPVQRGARIIELKQGESALHAESWIALESGNKEYQRPVNRMQSKEAPSQTVCRSGAVRVHFNIKSGASVCLWFYVLFIVILAV